MCKKNEIKESTFFNELLKHNGFQITHHCIFCIGIDIANHRFQTLQQLLQLYRIEYKSKQISKRTNEIKE